MTEGKTVNVIRLTKSTTMYFPYFLLRCRVPKTNHLTFSVHAAKTVSSNLANSREIDTRTVESLLETVTAYIKKIYIRH